MATGPRLLAALCAAGLTATAGTALASSHREAIAILNEPCADNTDVYAWVSPGAHDKLYLIGNFLPLHEPGQGNQGLRACTGYRYEFHIGKGESLADDTVYRVVFNRTPPPDEDPGRDTTVGGGNELLYQLTGSQETFEVSRVRGGVARSLGVSPVAPNNHGPQTDRLVYQLGAFAGYDSKDPTSREVGLYDDAFAARYIGSLNNGGRAFAGQRDDPFYLDEKGIFDLVNLCRAGLFNIPGARRTACEDVFAGFNVFTVALEIPTSELFPGGIPHNGSLMAGTTDSLLRVWFGISRETTPGNFVQVGREALPLFNAGIVGSSRQTKYLQTTPMTDVSNFGGDILNPVLVRDAEALGIYASLGIDPNTAGLKHNRVDIIRAINLGRNIPIADGFTGDVITIDAATDSQFPNGRSLETAPGAMREPVDVSDVLISLIVAGNPAAGAGDGVNSNDKPYLGVFPFVPGPHQGLHEGHGAAAP